MATRTEQHEARLEKWKKEIEDCRSSGKRVSEWCSEHGVSPKTYRRWERELYGANNSENRSRQKRRQKPEAAVEFTEITASEPSGNRGKVVARIKLAAAEVEIYVGADMGTVEALCRGLRYAE